MPTSNSFRWLPVRRARLANEVRRFNANITRALKLNPDLSAFLPKKLSTEQVKAQITTSKEFTEFKNMVERSLKNQSFQPVTTKQGIKTTKFEIKETQLKVNRLNKMRKEKRELSGASPQTGTMGMIKDANLLPKKFNINAIKPNEWERYIQGVEKQLSAQHLAAQNDTYKANYFKGLDDVFGNRANRIKEFLKDVDGGVMFDKMLSNPFLSIQFYYDEQIKGETVIDKLMFEWRDELEL